MKVSSTIPARSRSAYERIAKEVGLGATTVYRILKNERRKGRIFPKVKRRLDPEKEERRIGRMREAFYNPKDPRKQAERISRFVEYSD